MFWIVEYDNGQCSDYENEGYLAVCSEYVHNQESGQKEYERVKKRLSEIADPGFENVEIYCEFFADQLLTNFSIYDIITIEREVMIMRIDVSIICPFCGEDHAVEVNLAQYEAWQNGELIQNAMPDLTPTEREQLISGLCPKCQAEVFGE